MLTIFKKTYVILACKSLSNNDQGKCFSSIFGNACNKKINCVSPIEMRLVLALHVNRALRHQRNLLSIYLKVHLLNIVNYIKCFVFWHETKGWIWMRTFRSRVWPPLNVSLNIPDWQCVSVHEETVWTWSWLWLWVHVYCHVRCSVHFIACHFHLIHRKDPNVWTMSFSSNIKKLFTIRCYMIPFLLPFTEERQELFC